MLEIKNIQNVMNKVFLDWNIYNVNEHNDRYELTASAQRSEGATGLIIKIFKEEQANNEYNVRIVYRSYGNEIYNDNWMKGGFGSINTFLANIGLVVSNYERRYKIK